MESIQNTINRNQNFTNVSLLEKRRYICEVIQPAEHDSSDLLDMILSNVLNEESLYLHSKFIPEKTALFEQYRKVMGYG